MVFEQVQIQVRKAEQFEQLRAAIERTFTGAVERLLKRFRAEGISIREFEKAIEMRVFEAVDPALAQSGRSASRLYAELTLSDQALLREFYLERVEQVDPKARQRFKRIYQYY